MGEHEVATTDAEIDRALQAAKLLRNEPLARRVEHIPRLNLLIVTLSNHRRLVLPIEDLQGLGGATHQQLQHHELLGGGTGISFPDLDVDLYESTLEGLKFFYPRMSRGAILISHDYQSATGVDRAFSEFFSDKPESVVSLSGYQCLVTKL